MDVWRDTEYIQRFLRSEELTYDPLYQATMDSMWTNYLRLRGGNMSPNPFPNSFPSPLTVPSSGWICPRCSRVYAPWVWECRPCNTESVANSSTTNIRIEPPPLIPQPPVVVSPPNTGTPPPQRTVYTSGSDQGITKGERDKEIELPNNIIV